MNVLVIALPDGGQLDAGTSAMVGAARELVGPTGGEVHVLVPPGASAEVATQAARLFGVARVLAVAGGLPQAESLTAESLARQLVALAPGYRWLVGAHAALLRAALPRAAALCDGGYLSDVVRIREGGALERPMYAGAVLARLESRAAVNFLTLRASSFASVAMGDTAAPVELVAAAEPDRRTRVVGRELASSQRPDLGRARIVVAGGRGVGSAQNMALVEQLADHLGAAVGASRAAVDAGFAPNAAQVGQTGRTVAPDIYIALGISGAIQHLAGIKDAKCIVAVNKDADAPIFQVADYGVVGDLFDALPALRDGLPESRAA